MLLSDTPILLLVSSLCRLRNSTQLVEAAFDGDLDAMKDYIQKGYHIESVDGRKHTALSEAASQGHVPLVQYLLENGANPNALNDTNRSPLWRASFNGHIEVARILLEAGGSLELSRDKVSMESAFDVAKGDEMRDLLNSWDNKRTQQLMEQRRQVIIFKPRCIILVKQFILIVSLSWFVETM